MYVACECLNVIAESKIQRTLDFSPTIVENDSFFSLELCEMESVKVTEQLPKFIQTRKSGQWVIRDCTFCGCDVYAAKDKLVKDSIVVPKQRLIGAEQIATKKKSSSYSPFFNVIIDHSDISVSNINENNLESKLPRDVLLWLEEQANLTEERIQMFSDNEYAALENLKRRILKDSEVIFRKSLSSLRKGSDPSPIKKFNERRDLDLSSIQIEIESISDNTNVNKIESPIFESDEMFFLDDVDIKETLPDYCEDVMNEDIEDGYSADQDSPNCPISRSLPVPVPQFMKDKRSKDKNVTPEGPCDIAASIEALTRSLHGDNIFGDLPPPRFSTTNL